MFKKTFSFAGTLLLTGAAVLLMPGLSQAQHGGGHGGGGHFGGGGAHFSSGGGGGVHFSGGGSHFSGGGMHFSGVGSHFSGGGTHFANGGSHFRAPGSNGGVRLGGFRHGHGGFGSFYGGYGLYPYYGSFGGYYPYYDESSAYLSSSPMYDSGYSNTYGDVVPDFGYGTAPAAPAAADYQTIYPSATAPAATDYYQTLYPSLTATLQPDTPAHITVKAPADAQVRFNGKLTAATGTVREFESPPLAAGKYSYDIQAHWTENGQDVTQTRQVVVTPGARVEVDFPAAPPRTAAG